MKKYSVFVHQLAADPASLHSKRTAVAKLGNFPNKVLCSEILVCPVVQELTVLEHMHGCMELEGDVEHFCSEMQPNHSNPGKHQRTFWQGSGHG